MPRGRPKKCPSCKNNMMGPDYQKTKVALPPETDCPECEEFRNRGSRLTFIKVYTCPECEKVITVQMTPKEIKAHRLDFHWGSSDITPKSKEKRIKRAKAARKQEQETTLITNTIVGKLDVPATVKVNIVMSPLQQFINKLTQCPQVNRVYLTPPPNFAPHLLEKGWEIFELHIVPNGRPPYFEIEAIFAGVEKEEDAISEMIGERVFLKITDTIHLVRIIEQPERLGHI